MSKKDWLVVAGTALVTVVVTVALCRGLPEAIAVEQDNVKVVTPVLEVDGVKLSLALTLEAGQASCKSGEKPKVTLRAVNEQSDPIILDVTVAMTTMQPVSAFSRMMPMASQVWSKECEVELGSLASRAIDLPTSIAVQAGQTVTFMIKVGDKSMRALSFSVPAPEKVPAESKDLGFTMGGRKMQVFDSRRPVPEKLPVESAILIRR